MMWRNASVLANVSTSSADPAPMIDGLFPVAAVVVVALVLAGIGLAVYLVGASLWPELRYRPGWLVAVLVVVALAFTLAAIPLALVVSAVSRLW